MKKLISLSFILLAIFFIYKTDKKTKKIVKTKIIKKPVKKIKRNIASYKKKNNKNEKIKIKKLTQIKNNFFPHIDKKSKVLIYKKKEIPYTFNKARIIASIVQVKIQNQNGSSSSFDALIDEKNNRVLKTWNQTLFEKDHSFKISARGREFYSN